MLHFLLQLCWRCVMLRFSQDGYRHVGFSRCSFPTCFLASGCCIWLWALWFSGPWASHTPGRGISQDGVCSVAQSLLWQYISVVSSGLVWVYPVNRYQALVLYCAEDNLGRMQEYAQWLSQVYRLNIAIPLCLSGCRSEYCMCRMCQSSPILLNLPAFWACAF